MRAAALWPAALTAVALLWAGMVLGVGFIAVPAQFGAVPSLPVGIDVTRHVFTAFIRIELGLAALTLILALLARPGRLAWALLALLWLIVAMQSFWLLPALDARADQLLQGQEPAPGSLHALFAGSETTKLVVLLLIGLAGRAIAGGRRT